MKRLIAVLSAALLCALPAVAAVPTTTVKSGQSASGTSVGVPTPQAWVKLCADGSKVAADAECAPVTVPGSGGTVIDAGTSQNGVFVFDKAGVTGAKISGYTINHAYRCIETPTGSVLKQVEVSNLRCLDNYRGALRIRDSDGVTIRNLTCQFKAAPATSMKDLPACIQTEGSAKNIVIENLVCDGYRMALPPTSYQNGDCVNGDSTSGPLTLRNVTVNGSTDGGADVKARPFIIEGTYNASGNKRQLRSWFGTDASTATLKLGCTVRPVGSGGTAMVWMRTGHHHFKRIEINCPSKADIIFLFDSGPSPLPTLTVDECVINVGAGSTLMHGQHGKVVLGPGCVVP